MRCGASHVRRGWRGVVAVGLSALLAGCATGLQSMPLPAPSQKGDSISLTAAFSNALNLPSQAKVKLNGANVGEVESIRAQNFTALVTMKISTDVALHVGATAELRSATPLGDIFVAVRPGPNPTPDAPLLRDGDTIPLDSTSAAPTIEEVLTSAALLVNGGAVRRLVQIVNGAGAAVGGRGEKVATLLAHSRTLLTRLNARSAQIDGALRSTSELAADLSARQDTLNEALTALAPATSVLRDDAAQLADVTDAVARITRQVNRFPSLQGTDTRSMVADLNRTAAMMNDISVDPHITLNAWNLALGYIIKLSGGPNLHATADLNRIALGALPDKNYPGDPMFHGPDGTDWHALVGSFRYQWNLLLSRIYGPEHQPR
ncbi:MULTISPECIES: MCE family protein [unclassified Mycobacterium]|uniref:MlaD family protein n=1 Tax=unclassified Mycobacterium TaxID=2642494 RepID=UPI0029C7C9CB|nr:MULTISPECIES: MCE family protein [unclassified Mycobacterium]